MAQPLTGLGMTGSGAVETVEEAIHVLRSAGIGAWAAIWTGAIPFALAILLFWRDMTGYHRSTRLCAFESLLLVSLLFWMNVWRGAFAAKIYSELAGTAVSPGVTGRAGTFFLLGNLKLLLMPFAVATVLGIPSTVAFFRMATAVAAVGPREFSATTARARKLSASLPQPVLLILLLAFIGVLLFLNVAALLALLPQLALILTGYESPFTRAGSLLFADPAFYLVAVLITWLAFEPLVQTVYTVAAFHAESEETGEDVRARFRALLASASIAVLLLIACIPARAGGPGIDPSALDGSVRQTLAAPAYAWSIARDTTPREQSSFVRFTDALVARLARVRRAIGQAIDTFVGWLRQLFRSTPAPQQQGPPAKGAIRDGLFLALAAALSIAVILIWNGRRAVARRRSFTPVAPQPVRLEAENVTADQLPEQGWYALAEECLNGAQLRLALRALYLANLAGLAHDGWIAIHPGKTDHEHERELRRRARRYPNACELFSTNVVLFERVWYGNYPVSLDDCRDFRRRIAEMKHAMAATEVPA